MAETESADSRGGGLGERRKLVVLGSTGSIGKNTLDVIRHMGGRERFSVLAVTGMGNTELLAAQAVETGARLAVTADPARYGELKERLAGTGVEAAAGPDALCEAASMGADWVMAGIVGVAGLAPTLAAARSGAVIALANKECLVSAGALFMAEVEKAGGTLLPVDSEHNAIFQVLDRTQPEAVERIVLTASGGPFRDWPMAKMRDVTPAQAAAHPNWSMGQKISIDSASLFNKALEMIEADRLFGAPGRSLEVVIHPQSVIHSMVGYRDGSILAQLGSPDMRTAIGYALGWPERPHLPVERLDFAKVARLDFFPPDEARFPALRLARAAIAHGGLSGAVLNGAKEAALEAFIAGRIGFLEIADKVEAAMEALLPGLPQAFGLDDVFEADGQARDAVAARLARRPYACDVSRRPRRAERRQAVKTSFRGAAPTMKQSGSDEDGASPSQLIDAKIAALADWRGETLARLRDVIRQADPGVVEAVKWRKPSNPSGVPVWERAGILCTGDAFKDKVKLTFAKGALLPDPSGLFNASLEGNAMRAIDLREGEWIDEAALKALVRAAVALNTSKRAAARPVRSRRTPGSA